MNALPATTDLDAEIVAARAAAGRLPACKYAFAEALGRCAGSLRRAGGGDRQVRRCCRARTALGALHLEKWGLALHRLGKHGDARKQLNAAAGMDLAASDRIRVEKRRRAKRSNDSRKAAPTAFPVSDRFGSEADTDQPTAASSPGRPVLQEHHSSAESGTDGRRSHQPRRQTRHRLFAGIATSTTACRPACAARAWIASASRIPERGSRAFSDASKSRLLELV